jgi:hypothetical protein
MSNQVSSFCERGDHRKCIAEGFAKICGCPCGHPDSPMFLRPGAELPRALRLGEEFEFSPTPLTSALCASNLHDQCRPGATTRICACSCHFGGLNITRPREYSASVAVVIDRLPIPVYPRKPDSMTIQAIDDKTIRVCFVYGSDEFRFEGPRENMREHEPAHDPGQVTSITVDFVGFRFTGHFLALRQEGSNDE